MGKQIEAMRVETKDGPRYYLADGTEVRVVPAFQASGSLPGYCSKCHKLIPEPDKYLGIHPDYICKCQP